MGRLPLVKFSAASLDGLGNTHHCNLAGIDILVYAGKFFAQFSNNMQTITPESIYSGQGAMSVGIE
jgi:hypothetical protein